MRNQLNIYMQHLWCYIISSRMQYTIPKVFLLSKINVNYKNEINYIIIDYTKVVINKINELYNILILDF
mgnify:CR=1 FL=1